jgi:hypothetical protein
MGEIIRVEFVDGQDVDPAELDALTRALRAEILEVDEVERVEQASAGPAPEGSKGLDVAAIGALIVGVAPGVQAAAKVIDVVRNWLANRSPATPPLQMSIGDKSIIVVADKKQQDMLIAAFVAALTTGQEGEVGDVAESAGAGETERPAE